MELEKAVDTVAFEKDEKYLKVLKSVQAGDLHRGSLLLVAAVVSAEANQAQLTAGQMSSKEEEQERDPLCQKSQSRC